MHENQKQAIVRLIVLGVMILNAILAHYGKHPIPVSEEFIYQMVSDIILISTVAYTAYKNNDLTDEAVKGTAVTHQLKNKPMTQAEFDKFIEVKDQFKDAE